MTDTFMVNLRGMPLECNGIVCHALALLFLCALNFLDCMLVFAHHGTKQHTDSFALVSCSQAVPVSIELTLQLEQVITKKSLTMKIILCLQIS